MGNAKQWLGTSECLSCVARLVYGASGTSVKLPESAPTVTFVKRGAQLLRLPCFRSNSLVRTSWSLFFYLWYTAAHRAMILSSAGSAFA